ncbi:MAG: ATP-binding protein [Tannerellaceae bacterium]|nr:ATP-binding protein [Tannerellaceae bacterium]
MKMIRTLYYSIFCCLVMPFAGFSENVVKQLTNADGLSNNSINCIFEDSNHTLWVGTWDGLNAYNGRDFQTHRYNRNSSSSISNNVIRQVFEQSPGRIWISTDYGVNLWDESRQQFTNYFPGTEQEVPKEERSYIIGLTRQGQVVCYVKQQGFFFFNDKTQLFQSLAVFLPEGEVRDFVVDSTDQVWLLYESGRLEQYRIAYEPQTNRLSFVNPHLIEPEHSVNSIFFSNGMVILDYGNYLKLLDDKNLYPTGINIDPARSVSCILYYGDRLLISYYDGGCVVYDMHSREFLPVDGIPAYISIFSLYRGSQDILWIGTDGQGLLKVYEHNSPFHTVTTNHPVRAFCPGEGQQLLVGTKGDGIRVFDKEVRQTVRTYTVHDGLLSNSVYAIRSNQAGDIFIGTEAAGLNILYKNSSRPVTLSFPEQSPYFKAVYSICFTNKDSLLWLGTSGFGLVKVALQKRGATYEVQEVEQFASFGDVQTLNNNVIYSIVSGFTEDELWLGTRGGGISRLDKRTNRIESLEEIDSSLSLTSNDVLSLTMNEAGLWIGTSYGLNLLAQEGEGYRLTEYTGEQGLPNTTIHGILSVSGGDAWVSTNQGLAHIGPGQQVVNYSAKDGLQNDEFSDGAYFSDEDDTFYFGGVSGFSFFHPGQIYLRTFDPDVRLEHLRIYNTTRHTATRIRDGVLKLAYDEAYVTFTFIAQDFINNENCEYDYRLLNFSDEWIRNGNNPNVVFTRLPPGKYTLQVRATNGDRVWGSGVYSLLIVVAHPWWLSTVAFVIYFILFAALAYTVYRVIRNRIRLNRELLLEHIEKQNQQKLHESKLNFLTNVAHEFFTPLTLIYGPAQHLLEKADLDPYTRNYVRIIKNNSDRMQKLINELMEFRKVESGYTPLHPESIDIKLLMDYIVDNYSDIARENKIEFIIEKENISSLLTDRNSLEKIVFNLISNAFKYTPDNGYIHVRVWQTDDRFYLTIRNSGKGLTERQMSEIFNRFRIFDSSRLAGSRSTGIGLGLAKSLAELLGGNIEVNSRLGEYVEFKVTIPPMQPGTTEELQEEAVEALPASLAGETPVQRDISILIVEDERNIRELLRDILSPWYRITEAGDGIEALEQIEQNMPDIIISDILMPHLDGTGLIDTLKSDPVRLIFL